MGGKTSKEVQRRASAAYRKRHPDRVKENRKRNFKRELEYNRSRRANLETWPIVALPLIRHRAKAKGIECTITAKDIVVPMHCPVLGIALESGVGTRNCSPSVDRFDNGRGYVSGNVNVISHRANRLKCDATIEELELVLSYMRGKSS